MASAPHILVFAGSTRGGALSGKVAAAAAKALALHGAEVTRIDLADYPLPLMDQDLEADEGIPANALRLARLFARAHGVLIASPEYNHSIPPLLKNTLDWLSRVKADGAKPLRPFKDKVAALCSSSDGGFAGIRGLVHLHAVLMACGVEVVTPQCSVARAQDAFDEDGELREERTRRQLDRVAAALVERARILARGPEGFAS